ncbi:MAG: hypothetical protein FWE80_06580 [Oscillospiraceae bacterium]|nr:hypothetical protein [Oscillospiraceae bacterium]
MKLSAVAKRMIGVTGISWLVLAAGSAVWYRSLGCLPFAAGALAGSALNAVKIIMIDRASKKVAGMEKTKAANYVRIQHLLRFLLTAGVLTLIGVLAYTETVPASCLYGAAAGVLTFQIAVYSIKNYAVREAEGHQKTDGEKNGG